MLNHRSTSSLGNQHLITSICAPVFYRASTLSTKSGLPNANQHDGAC